MSTAIFNYYFKIIIIIIKIGYGNGGGHEQTKSAGFMSDGHLSPRPSK
jgi:hypothetical protein